MKLTNVPLRKILDPLKDGKSRIELIDYLGGDLAVINDAKASFDRVSDVVDEKGIKLINYLIEHQHTSPLRGTVFKFKVKAPLFCCRQWWKHTVASSHNDSQLGWNETSLRYVEIKDSNEFYIPEIFRKQSKDNKQSTIGSLVTEPNGKAIATFQEQCESSYQAYSKLLELGVGREQARGVLVPAVYVSWVWTVSLQALLNFIELRTGEGAQSEIALYAEAIKDLIQPIVPHVLEAWERK